MLLASERQMNIGLLLLRFALGGLMLVHGIQKVSAFGTLRESFPDPIGLGSQLSLLLAIGAEVGCAVLLILGALTRLSLIPLTFTMVVALFIVHAEDPWRVKELAALYLAGYIGLFFTGPGTLSVDRWLLSRGTATQPDS